MMWVLSAETTTPNPEKWNQEIRMSREDAEASSARKGLLDGNYYSIT
jgi:hypothetical protein